jgi:hypothetical protein
MLARSITVSEFLELKGDFGWLGSIVTDRDDLFSVGLC